MRAVGYSRQGPYLVLDQVWPALVVQAQGRQAAVRRAAMQAEPPEPAPETLPSPTQTSPADEQAPGASYSVDRADGHMRRTVARWAQQAGWVFQAEHWSVDVDIPVVGDAVFDMPFEQAVQSLLAATELSDRPLQPCFYSNKVVRVVAFAQACDRTAPPGERA